MYKVSIFFKSFLIIMTLNISLIIVSQSLKVINETDKPVMVQVVGTNHQPLQLGEKGSQLSSILLKNIGDAKSLKFSHGGLGEVILPINCKPGSNTIHFFIRDSKEQIICR